MSSLVQLASVSMSSSCTLTFRSPRCLQIQDSSTYGNSYFSVMELLSKNNENQKKNNEEDEEYLKEEAKPHH